jgi:hypothetical protein
MLTRIGKCMYVVKNRLKVTYLTVLIVKVKDKTVIITGDGSGMDKSIALLFAQRVR